MNKSTCNSNIIIFNEDNSSLKRLPEWKDIRKRAWFHVKPAHLHTLNTCERIIDRVIERILHMYELADAQLLNA